MGSPYSIMEYGHPGSNSIEAGPFSIIEYGGGIISGGKKKKIISGKWSKVYIVIFH